MGDITHILQAVYRADVTLEAWLQGLAEALRPTLDEGFGLLVWLRGSGPDAQGLVAHAGMSEALGTELVETFVRRVVHAAEPVSQLSAWLGVGMELPHTPSASPPLVDVAVLSSCEAGWQLRVAVPQRRSAAQLDAVERRRLRAIAGHLAAGLRLLRMLSPALTSPPETMDGAGTRPTTIERSDGLRASALQRDEAQALAERADAELASSDGRGALRVIDQFDHGDRRYLVVEQEQAPTAPQRLTRRQLRALALRELGYPLKRIAAELGVSISTVSVDLERASSALGQATRPALLE